MDGSASDAAKAPTHLLSSRMILLTTFAVVTLNSIDRQLINILAQNIKLDLSLTDAQLGLLTGTALAVLKALFSMPVASFADRVSRPRTLAALVAITSAFSMLCSASVGFLSLAACRMGAGVGESGTVPIAAAVAREHSKERPTSDLALVMSGTPLGAFLAFLLGGAIADRWGWRSAFMIAGAPGLVLVIVIMVKFKTLARTRHHREHTFSWFKDVHEFLRKAGAKPLVLATCASMLLVSAATAWIPALLIRAHHLRTSEAGLYAAFAFGLGGGLGALSGIFCELTRRRIAHPESAMMIGSLSLAVPFLLLTTLSQSTGVVVASYFCFSLLASAWLAPTIRMIQDVVGAHQRALAIAICSAAGIGFGLGFGVPLIGWLSDALSATYGHRSLAISLAVTLSATALFGMGCHIWLLRTSRQARDARGTF